MVRPMIEISDDFLIDSAIKHHSLRTSEKDILDHPSVHRIVGVLQRALGRCSMVQVVVNEVLHVVKRSASIDWLLFLSEHSHRDHLLHQFRVALIADWLLHYIFRTKVADGDYEMTRAMLWSAALVHDHGYALSRLVSLIPTLFLNGTGIFDADEQGVFLLLRKCYEGTYSPTIMERLCVPPNAQDKNTKLEVTLSSEIRAAVGEYFGVSRANLDARVLAKLCSEGSNVYDHGLWSALNMAARFDDAGLPWRHRHDEIPTIRNLLEAIAAHNHSEFSGSDFDVSRNPLSGILVLADEIQEWNRPILSRAKQVTLQCRVLLDRPSRSKLGMVFEYDHTGLHRAGLAIKKMKRLKSAAFQRIKGAAGLPSIDVNCHSVELSV